MKKYIKKHEMIFAKAKIAYISFQYFLFNKRNMKIFYIIGITKTLLRNTKCLNGRLNFILCELHREVFIKILNEILKLKDI